MTIRDVKGFIEDRIPVKNVLVSVFDKRRLDELIPELIQINPRVQFLSTGGTYEKIKHMLGQDHRENLIEVSEYTSFPEMEGGLVKTLHPKIHAGILGERNNPEHQAYLDKTLQGAKYIDLVVANLYPFQTVVSAPDVTFEKARGNIDIGGPAMIRGAAKNFMSCSVVCNPSDYGNLLDDIVANNGATSFNHRLMLAQKAFALTARYDANISEYFREQVSSNWIEIRQLYEFNKGTGND